MSIPRRVYRTFATIQLSDVPQTKGWTKHLLLCKHKVNTSCTDIFGMTRSVSASISRTTCLYYFDWLTCQTLNPISEPQIYERSSCPKPLSNKKHQQWALEVRHVFQPTLAQEGPIFSISGVRQRIRDVCMVKIHSLWANMTEAISMPLRFPFLEASKCWVHNLHLKVLWDDIKFDRFFNKLKWEKNKNKNRSRWPFAANKVLYLDESFK